MLFFRKDEAKWRREFVFFPKQVGITPDGNAIVVYLCWVESRVLEVCQSYERIEYRLKGSSQSHVNHVSTSRSSYV